MPDVYKSELNEKQHEALLSIDEPLLILAGAGSGKTRVITYKIAYLIDKIGYSPYEILALTFTNKAADEMKNRVTDILSKEGGLYSGMWVSTFHSFCARILRREAHNIGYTNNFTIYDTDDSKKLVRDIVKKYSHNSYLKNPAEVYFNISNRKNKPYPQKADFENYLYKEDLYNIYLEYEKRLFNQNAVDFDNLILKTIELFNTNEVVLRYYQGLFKYILVDEFQDTNEAQYELVRLLTGNNNNVSIVGDDDQSIYAFRGASVKNLIRFTEDFENCRVIRLEQNYRSTKRILKAANSVIDYNSARMGKNLWSDNDEGDNVKLIVADDDYEEGRMVVEILRKEIETSNHVGIFYRVNYQSRIFEEILKQSGIQYKIFGTVKFYERREIKDILAYLNFLVNPKDDLNLKRIINIPKRGIGQRTVDELSRISEDLGLPLFNAIKYASDNELFNKRANTNITKFVGLIEKINKLKDELVPVEFIRNLLKEIGYFDYLLDDEQQEDRINNIQEFIRGVDYHISNNDEATIETFLQEIALYTDLDKYDENANNVSLMTVHNAKGLEFDTVFITGLEEGTLPHGKSLDSSEDIEEERRLFYVAVTRAKKKLYLSRAKYRKSYGRNMPYLASRFLNELDDDVTEYYYKYQGSNKSMPRKTFASTFKQDTNKKQHIPTINPNDFDIGDILIHEKYGEGKVTFKKGEGDLTTIKLAFSNNKEKLFILKYAKLKKKECA